jgi:hypothetical protein
VFSDPGRREEGTISTVESRDGDVAADPVISSGGSIRLEVRENEFAVVRDKQAHGTS